MATLKDYIPDGVKFGFFALACALAVGAAVERLYIARKTGAIQRLPSTPKYTRSGDPLKFWLLIVFYVFFFCLFAGILIAVTVHWFSRHDRQT
jgi:hypothetical protein